MSEQQDLVELAAVVIRVLDDWGVAPEDQPVLLGLPAGTRGRAMERYRRGMTPLPGDRETLQRISYLLTIERAVQTAFPHNAAMARYWVTTPQALFAGRSPLEIMLAEGVEGIEQVVRHLQCADGW